MASGFVYYYSAQRYSCDRRFGLEHDDSKLGAIFHTLILYSGAVYLQHANHQ